MQIIPYREKRPSKKELAIAKHFAKYAGKWVGIIDNRVVAWGDDILDVDKMAEEKGVTGFAYGHLPPRGINLLRWDW